MQEQATRSIAEPSTAENDRPLFSSEWVDQTFGPAFRAERRKKLPNPQRLWSRADHGFLAVLCVVVGIAGVPAAISLIVDRTGHPARHRAQTGTLPAMVALGVMLGRVNDMKAETERT